MELTELPSGVPVVPFLNSTVSVVVSVKDRIPNFQQPYFRPARRDLVSFPPPRGRSVWLRKPAPRDQMSPSHLWCTAVYIPRTSSLRRPLGASTAYDETRKCFNG